MTDRKRLFPFVVTWPTGLALVRAQDPDAARRRVIRGLRPAARVDDLVEVRNGTPPDLALLDVVHTGSTVDREAWREDVKQGRTYQEAPAT